MDTLIVDMTADKFWALLSKKVSGEASQDELDEFEKLTVDKPEWRKTEEALSALWQQPVLSQHEEAEKAFESHLRKMQQLGVDFNDGEGVFPEVALPEKNSKRSSKRRWLIPLVATAVSVTAFILFDRKSSSPQKVFLDATAASHVSTKSGSTSKIELPDGSSVWLNASSELTYNKDFGKNLREVNLTGEAFFDVIKDPEHPFIIHTKVIDVKVLGTEFNVKAYPDDSYTEASLIRGSLEVTVNNRPDEKHFLKPNEKVSVPNHLNQPEKIGKTKSLIVTEPLTYYHEDSTTIIETSWVDHKLVFQENETFGEVALKMERWYGRHIIFANDKIKEYRLYGSFTTETITEALDALKEASKFSYKVNGNDIIITQ